MWTTACAKALGQERAGKEAYGIPGERTKETEFKMRWGRQAGAPHSGRQAIPKGATPHVSVKWSFLGEEGVS